MSNITVPTTLTAISSVAFGAAVANMLNQEDDYQTFTPGSTLTSTGAGGPTTWVTFNNLTVPAWATKARVTIHGCAISGSAAAAVATVNPLLGSVASAGRRWQLPNASGQRFQASAAWLLTGISTGSQAFALQATFVSGTLAADVTSTFDITVDYVG